MCCSHIQLNKISSEFGLKSKTTINQIINDSKYLLKQLSAEIISEKAHSVAKQAEIYLKSHNKTLSELQQDEKFRAIAVQPVGKTGYTALTEYPSGICRFHKKREIENVDLHSLADKLPEFWQIMSKSLTGKESYGFYTWKEPDTGKLREKYMHIVPINATTADGKHMTVAATTYTDEFYEQIIQLEQISRQRIEELTKKMNKTFTTLKTILTAIFTGAIIFAIAISFILTKKIVVPLKKLTAASNQLKKGRFNVKLASSKTSEINELSEAFRRMRSEIKLRDALLNTLLKALKGKYGKLTTILVRKDIQRLIDKDPKIKKLLPKNLRRLMKD